MKKIKAKITNVYNRYLSLISKKTLLFFNNLKVPKEIKIQARIINRSLNTYSKKIFLFIVRLKFMKNNKVDISVFNRYLILLIVILFSYLFYLSSPNLYNYGELQKELTKKILKEFNLDTALSSKIIYKILPSPNFEISNVMLNENTDNKLNNYAQIKKMKIYISVKNLHNQKKLEIKNIVISEANININKDSYQYLNNYFKKKISNKKFQIKKSKIFFKESDPDQTDMVTLSNIKKSNLIYDQKNSTNKLSIDGSIYNTKYNLNILRKFEEKNTINFELKFKKINTTIKNEFKENNNGKLSLNFLGSEINIDYKILDKIYFSSNKSIFNNNKINFQGEMNLSPFYYDANVNLNNVNAYKLFENLSKLKNLLDEKILLNKKLNGKIIFEINSLKGIKFFDKALINLSILNGKLILDNTTFFSNKIGKMIFTNSFIEQKDDKRIFKSNILFELLNQKKFYQKLQIPKNSRIELKNIYFELEKDLYIDDIIIKKLIINKKNAENSRVKAKDLTNSIDLNEINNLENWIEFKKFLVQLFSVASKIN